MIALDKNQFEDWPKIYGGYRTYDVVKYKLDGDECEFLRYLWYKQRSNRIPKLESECDGKIYYKLSHQQLQRDLAPFIHEKQTTIKFLKKLIDKGFVERAGDLKYRTQLLLRLSSNYDLIKPDYLKD